MRKKQNVTQTYNRLQTKTTMGVTFNTNIMGPI